MCLVRIRFRVGSRAFTLLEIMVALTMLVMLASVTFRTVGVVLTADANAYELERQSLGVQGLLTAIRLEEEFLLPHVDVEESLARSSEGWRVFEVGSEGYRRRSVEVAFRVGR